MRVLHTVRRRLDSQFLTTSGPKTGREVVRALGAVQAQDYAGAKWALSMRTGGATDVALERELDAGSIIRTHVLRPTWHFVAAEDIRWMLALTSPRVNQAMAYYNRTFELTPEVFRRSNATIERALAGGKHLTRSELRAFLERAKLGRITGQRVGHLMMQAELDAVVCSGARRGKEFTYALLDERVAAAPAFQRDEALLGLTRRYFSTRAPATAHDFAWWSGLTIADVKRGIAIAGAELERVVDDDRTYFLSANAKPASKAKSAHLLPNYDEYFIGLKDRSAIGERLRTVESVRGASALLGHVVVVDGQLVGGWWRRIETDAVVVRLDLRARVSSEERARIAKAARAFGLFLGLPVQLRSGSAELNISAVP